MTLAYTRSVYFRFPIQRGFELQISLKQLQHNSIKLKVFNNNWNNNLMEILIRHCLTFWIRCTS